MWPLLEEAVHCVHPEVAQWPPFPRPPSPLMDVTAILSFKYSPLARLRDIRLVCLRRGSGDEPICCELVIADITQQYEAVSYEWGCRACSKIIVLNGAPFKIGENLHNALLRFRRSRWDRILWVDALCINQDDDKEKTRQLQMMGHIYRHASDTLVWLGPAYDDSDLAMKYLKEIGENSQEASDALLRNENNPHEAEMRAIAALCNRPYWLRIWVVQEIRFASQLTIYCGDRTIPGEIFSLAGKHIQDAHNPKISHLLKAIKESLASKISDYHRLKDLRLKEWLVKTMDSESSDANDKVFALVNLATDCRGNSKQIVNCNKGITVSEVYKRVLRVCAIEKSTGLPVNDVFDLSQVLQRALNTNLQTVRLTAQDDEPIWICGVLSAKITSFNRGDKPSPRYHSLYPKSIFESEKTAWYYEAQNCILAPDASKSIGIIQKRRNSIPTAPVQTLDDITIDTTPLSPLDHDTLMEHQHSYRKPRMKNPADRGIPCRCSLGACTGFVPSNAEIGDKICRFPGSRVGLVFRGSGTGTWRLVGRAIMDERFQIDEKETEQFWRGKPDDVASVSFGSENAVYLCMSMVTLQRLTAE